MSNTFFLLTNHHLDEAIFRIVREFVYDQCNSATNSTSVVAILIRAAISSIVVIVAVIVVVGIVVARHVLNTPTQHNTTSRVASCVVL